MVDFENFISAARTVFSGGIPYGKHFFAPIWTAIWIYPFVLIPEPLNQWIWQFAIIIAVVTTCVLTIPKSRLFPVLIIFSPPTIYLLVDGQFSAFVALACTALLLEVAAKRRIWVLLVCSFIALSKPHLALLPISIALLTLLRKKDIGKAVSIVACLVGLTLLFELLIPNSTLQWIEAMFSGDYKVGNLYLSLPNGLIVSLGEFYFQGSITVFIPVFIIYLYYYFQESLTPRTIALTLCIMFLVLPYYRLYDLAMLIYPVGILYQETIKQYNLFSIQQKQSGLLTQETSPVRVET